MNTVDTIMGDKVIYSISAPGISKLKGSTNYASWKFDMKMALKYDGLWSCIEPRTTTTVDPDKDERALAKIAMHLEAAPKLHVRMATSAKEAWDILARQYEAKSTNRRIFLLDQLLDLKMEVCNSMSEYVSKFLDLNAQLADIEKPVDDEMKACLLLRGLPESYRAFRMAVESADKLEYNKVLEKLNSMAEKETTESSVVFSTFKSATGKSFTTKLNNNQANTNNNSKARKPFIPTCYKCRKAGHMIRDCPENNQANISNSSKVRSSSKISNSDGKNKNISWITALNVKVEPQSWYIDSCCSDNLSKNKDNFQMFNSNEGAKEVTVANNTKIYSAGSGKVSVNLKNFGERVISDVTYVPDLSTNLLSVSKIASKGQVIVFDDKGCSIYIKDGFSVTGEICGTGTNVNGLYRLDTESKGNIVPNIRNLVMSTQVDQLVSVDLQNLWHRRLGHLNHVSMGVLKKGMALGVDFPNQRPKACIPCVEGKHSRESFPTTPSKRAEAKLELIHTDVCGPMNVQSLQGNRFMLIFIDDFTRMTFGYFLKSKDQVVDCFLKFKTLVENQTNQTIKTVRSDEGGEYMNERLEGVCNRFGIRHQVTTRYSPEQNGVAERANRTIIEKARSMLSDSNLCKGYWQYAVEVAIYLKNRSPTKAVFGVTPQEKWTGSKVDLSHLRVFGCISYVHVPKERRTKLDYKSAPHIFVGYSEDVKGYKLVDPKSPRRVIYSRDVKFFESMFYNGREENNGDETIQPAEAIVSIQDTKLDELCRNPEAEEETFTLDSINIEQDDSNVGTEEFTEGDSENEEEGVEINFGGRYPLRVRKPKIFPDFVTYAVTCEDQEPGSYQQAIEDPNKNLWKRAMEEEYASLIKNNTWTLVDLPQGKNVVKCKWVYKIKKDCNGEIVKHKARLVAKGFTQKYGVDYEETFSPVVRFESLRVLFALAVRFDLSIDHLDVTCAFLNGELKEEIYMRQPEGFVKNDSETKVCRLNKAIYGLKQASKVWNEKCETVLQEMGFTQLELEPCIFVLFREGKLGIIALYVDDFLLFSNDDNFKSNVKLQLREYFEIKDLGEAKNVLGIRITRENDILRIDQAAYIEKILARFNMIDCNPATTPMEEGLDPKKPEVSSKNLQYQELIGSLMYLSVCTRPDITFSVTKLSQYNTCHSEEHFKYAKRVLRYLKGTKSYCITFTADEEPLHGFVDASHGNNFDGKSFTGYVFKLCGGPVSWGSKKQRCMTDSSTESEYVAMVQACKQAMFLKHLLEELGIFLEYVSLHCDNMPAMKILQKRTVNDKTKHITRKQLFVRDVIKRKLVVLNYVPTSRMVADILTKPLGKIKHDGFLMDLGITSMKDQD